MREIKFRGKNYDGIWLYGYLMPAEKPVINIGCKYRISASPNACGGTDKAIYEVLTNTIGQFTGLRDKNDKEIYEGDIVKWILTMPEVGVNGGYEEYETEKIGEIKWDAGALQLGDYCAAGFAYESEDYADIIGNIHDNPELLESL